MTDEAKRIVEVVRCAAVFCTHCDRRTVCASECSAYRDANKAADLIERLSAELEAAKRDMHWIGNSIDNSEGACCRWCKHYITGVGRMGDTESCAVMDYDEMADEIVGNCKFEWRGLCKENGGVMDGKGQEM